MNVRQTIGWNVRRLRVVKGLSQERLAFETDLDRAYVGRVERGSENVTVATLEKMATVLDVEVLALFQRIEDGAGLPPALPSGRKRKVE